MAIYTQLSESDLHQIIADFGVSDVLSFSPMEGGYSNTSHTVTAKTNKFVLTVLEEKNEEQAHQLAALLQWFNQQGFSTTKIQTTRSGELLSRYNQKPVILKHWITGVVIEDFSAGNLNDIGVALAQLHLVPVPDFLPREHAYGVHTFSDVVGKAIDVPYENWLQEKIQTIEKEQPQNLPAGVIHGDLFHDNILFEEGQLKAIIDFEEACFYYYIFDIGMSLVGICRAQNKINLSKAKSLVEGYEKIRPLEEREKESLQFFIEYAAIATSRWRFWKFNIDAPTERYKNRHWEMVKIADFVRSIPAKQFIQTIFS